MMRFLPIYLVLSVAAAPWAAAQQVSGTTRLTLDDESSAILSPEELHIRSGIVILAKLYQSMARVQDHDTAQECVPVLVRLTGELQAWGQGVAMLPPLDDAAKSAYESRYLPVIRKLNDHLRTQGERLAASDYFGSQDLATALMSLYMSTQQ